VNETLAARLRETFAIQEPVGAVVDLPVLGFGQDRRSAMTIVGVIGNERVQSDLRAPTDAIAYVPIAQAPRMQVKLSARTSGDAAAVVPPIRDALRHIDPQLALADIRTLEEIRSSSLSGLREPAWLIGAFAMLSLMLAAVGLYGVVSHAVTQQRREIGIRMALGATPRNVVSKVAGHVMRTIAIGLLAGIAGAYAATRVTQSLLFETSPLDPFAFAIAAVLMATVAMAAALVPATRATRVDPTTALRAE